VDIAFRADASSAIGTGHLMRCLTLADALAREGTSSIFLCAPAAEPWRDLVESRGHRFVALHLQTERTAVDAAPPHAGWAPWGQAADAAASLERLRDAVDWLIVDHYALDARWERTARAKARRILAIDDLADRDHDCDVLLDHNPQAETGSRYDRRLPPHARRLIGPRYALLRPEFAAARARRPARDGSLRRIAVFMGGTDPNGATLLAIEALAKPALRRIPVDIAIGAASPHLAAIRAAADARGDATVHVGLPHLADLFADADLAIGAGGVAALERCCVGLPTVTVAIAENQMPGLEWLAGHDAVRYLGYFLAVSGDKLSEALSALRAAPDVMRMMSERADALVDGEGTARVVSALLGSRMGVRVRAATNDDAELLHRWRNSDAVRSVSFTNEPIPFSDHCHWLRNALENPLQVILIGLAEDVPVGSVRYALSDRGADISIMVAPEMQGRGIGGELLETGEAYLRALHPERLLLRALIKPNNAASLQLFTRAGFKRAVDEPDRVLYVKDLV
jgi:UDP-2,4-diacetamido-2,4,6-trideoxy-beta-L-altropyranose hydrolase